MNEHDLSSVVSVSDDDNSKKEYLALFIHFQAILDKIKDGTITLSDLNDIVEQRAVFAFTHACTGFDMSFEEGLGLIRDTGDGDLTTEEREKRDILLAAFDNLVDFATVEEYQMLSEMIGISNGENTTDDDIEAIFAKYNDRYASVENNDIEYALGIAAAWIGINELSTITYMTQGDERVRDSHRALDGLTFTKRNFPEWLIPPIDWGCRCYLVTEFGGNILGGFNFPEDFKKNVNPIFARSIAKKGPIFSDTHPYFKVEKRDLEELKQMSKQIKKKLSSSDDDNQ